MSFVRVKRPSLIFVSSPNRPNPYPQKPIYPYLPSYEDTPLHPLLRSLLPSLHVIRIIRRKQKSYASTSDKRECDFVHFVLVNH